MSLKYETLEKLTVQQPVDRIDFIANHCTGKVVLDIGCLDETALIKRETRHWLHGRLVGTAKCVIGLDNSSKIPPEGLRTGENAMIYRSDGVQVDKTPSCRNDYDVIVAGEFIEHIPNPLDFLGAMKSKFPDRELIISTPNGVAFANTLLGLINREAQHPDHLHNFTFKVLNTLCQRAGFKRWEIIPYRFYATEMILHSRGLRRIFVRIVEQAIRLIERLFPLLSFGYIVRIQL